MTSDQRGGGLPCDVLWAERGEPSAGAGASKDRVIWVFETQKAFADFVNLGWDLGAKARAAAMVQDTGGMFSGAVSVAPGVYICRLTETGLSAELTVTGTKYLKDDELN